MRTLLVVIGLLLTLPAPAANERAVNVGVNLFKPLLGLPNLELEFQFDRRLTVHGFTEYWLFRTPLSPSEDMHPISVSRIGPRYYFFTFQVTRYAAGFYAGLDLGYAWYRRDNPTPLTVTAEAGYKHVFFDRVYVLPRLLATYGVNGVQVTPGFELIVGACF